jgi:hypothetical protein
MSDDESSNGLSGWAGVTLGRMWAEHDRSVDETLAWFGNRHRRQIDPAALLAQNEALAAENAQLRQDLAAYQHNYAKLRAWAEEAARDLKQLRGEQT